jgi:hypothetical protein
MGNVLTPATVFGTSDLTEEIQQSFNQVIQAFNHDFILEAQRHHHRRQYPSPISDSTNTQREESSHRSQSLDRYQSEEHQHTPHKTLSTIKRQWQCQLCHTKNESDALICADCGSNKINVYIPIIDHMNSNQRQLHTSISVPVR